MEGMASVACFSPADSPVSALDRREFASIKRTGFAANIPTPASPLSSSRTPKIASIDLPVRPVARPLGNRIARACRKRFGWLRLAHGGLFLHALLTF